MTNDRPHNKPHILILEDDPAISELYQVAFGEMAQITHCASGSRGEKLFFGNPDKYDLIILDDDMPGKRGMEFLEAICHYEKPLRLMVSSPQTLDAHETHAKVRSYKGLGLVKKPMGIGMLMSAVDDLLKYGTSTTLEDYFRANYEKQN